MLLRGGRCGWPEKTEGVDGWLAVVSGLKLSHCVEIGITEAALLHPTSSLGNYINLTDAQSEAHLRHTVGGVRAECDDCRSVATAQTFLL